MSKSSEVIRVEKVNKMLTEVRKASLRDVFNEGTFTDLVRRCINNSDFVYNMPAAIGNILHHKRHSNRSLEIILKEASRLDNFDIDVYIPHPQIPNDKLTLLFFATKRGDAQAVSIFLQNQADPNHMRVRMDGTLESALWFAVGNGLYDCARTLLENGANPNLGLNRADGRFAHPIEIAVDRGARDESYISLIELLIHYGADLNVTQLDRNYNPQSLLSAAMELGNNKVTKLLRTNGARRDIRQGNWGEQRDSAIEHRANKNMDFQRQMRTTIARLEEEKSNDQGALVESSQGTQLAESGSQASQPIIYGGAHSKHVSLKANKDESLSIKALLRLIKLCHGINNKVYKSMGLHHLVNGHIDRKLPIDIKNINQSNLNLNNSVITSLMKERLLRDGDKIHLFGPPLDDYEMEILQEEEENRQSKIVELTAKIKEVENWIEGQNATIARYQGVVDNPKSKEGRKKGARKNIDNANDKISEYQESLDNLKNDLGSLQNESEKQAKKNEELAQKKQEEVKKANELAAKKKLKEKESKKKLFEKIKARKKNAQEKELNNRKEQEEEKSSGKDKAASIDSKKLASTQKSSASTSSSVSVSSSKAQQINPFIRSKAFGSMKLQESSKKANINKVKSLRFKCHFNYVNFAQSQATNFLLKKYPDGNFKDQELKEKTKDYKSVTYLFVNYLIGDWQANPFAGKAHIGNKSESLSVEEAKLKQIQSFFEGLEDNFVTIGDLRRKLLDSGKMPEDKRVLMEEYITSPEEDTMMHKGRKKRKFDATAALFNEVSQLDSLKDKKTSEQLIFAELYNFVLEQIQGLYINQDNSNEASLDNLENDKNFNILSSTMSYLLEKSFENISTSMIDEELLEDFVMSDRVDKFIEENISENKSGTMLDLLRESRGNIFNKRLEKLSQSEALENQSTRSSNSPSSSTSSASASAAAGVEDSRSI